MSSLAPSALTSTIGPAAAASAEAAAGSSRSAAARGARLAVGAASLASCVLCWQLLASHRVNLGVATFANVPPPLEVLHAAWDLLHSPKLLRHLSSSPDAHHGRFRTGGADRHRARLADRAHALGARRAAAAARSAAAHSRGGLDPARDPDVPVVRGQHDLHHLHRCAVPHSAEHDPRRGSGRPAADRLCPQPRQRALEPLHRSDRAGRRAEHRHRASRSAWAPVGSASSPPR